MDTATIFEIDYDSLIWVEQGDLGVGDLVTELSKS